mmetsp:Transcript_12381/g.37775  ORF Transcript_12381/g.37775 Transcript_12381/m.37775 type:complete len:124 (+) Transcript_12381:2669-3040(+)
MRIVTPLLVTQTGRRDHRTSGREYGFSNNSSRTAGISYTQGGSAGVTVGPHCLFGNQHPKLQAANNFRRNFSLLNSLVTCCCTPADRNVSTYAGTCAPLVHTHASRKQPQFLDMVRRRPVPLN